MRIQTLKGGAICAVVAALLSTGAAFADEKANDFYFQQNQRRFASQQPMNAATLGVAGASLWSRADALSTVNNPAGLGMMKYGDISLNYSYNENSGHEFPTGKSIDGHDNMGSLFAATPLAPVKDGLPDYGNLGFGWSGRSGSWSKDTLGTDDDAYQLSVGYGKAISEQVSVGYSLSYYNDSVSNSLYDYSSSDSFLHTIGVQYAPSSDLVWGSTMAFGHGSHDLDVYNTGGGNTDQFSYGLATGVSYVMDQTTLSTGIDYTYYDNDGSVGIHDPRVVFGGDTTGHSSNFRLGVEQRLSDTFRVRGGYRYAANFDWDYKRPELDPLDGSAKYNAWSLGAGLNFPLNEGSFIKAVQLDYGAEYRDIGNGDWQQLVSLSTPFDLCR